MKKELPNVFANKINNIVDNTQKVYYSTKEKIDINELLDKIYKNTSYIFKNSIEIITKSGSSVEKIALRTKEYLLTLSNKKIKISDIIDIKPINKRYH